MGLACFKLVSTMKTGLARDLMNDEEWAFFKRFILAVSALNASGAVPHALQMIDSTVVRAHHPLPGRALRQQCPKREAAGAKGGLHGKVWAAQEVVSRPRSTYSSMRAACP